MMKKQSFRISLIVSPLSIFCGVCSRTARPGPSLRTNMSNKTLSGDYGFVIEGVAGLGSQMGSSIA